MRWLAATAGDCAIKLHRATHGSQAKACARRRGAESAQPRRVRRPPGTEEASQNLACTRLPALVPCPLGDPPRDHVAQCARNCHRATGRRAGRSPRVVFVPRADACLCGHPARARAPRRCGRRTGTSQGPRSALRCPPCAVLPALSCTPPSAVACAFAHAPQRGGQAAPPASDAAGQPPRTARGERGTRVHALVHEEVRHPAGLVVVDVHGMPHPRRAPAAPLALQLVAHLDAL